jgi:carboxylesterase type B
MFSFLTCLVSLALVSRALADDLLVKLQDGSMVNGHYAETGNREWAGLPFAAPPVGALRWQFPEEPAPLQGTFEADVLAPGCPQICHLPYGSCPETTSEDCLYLSVWAPAKPSEDPAG